MKKQKVYALMMSVYGEYIGEEQPFQVSIRRIYTSKEKAQAVCNRLLRETNLYKHREGDKYVWVKTHPELMKISERLEDLSYKKDDYYNLNKETDYVEERMCLIDEFTKCTDKLNKEWELTNKLSYEINKLEQKYYVEEVTLIIDNHNNG